MRKQRLLSPVIALAMMTLVASSSFAVTTGRQRFEVAEATVVEMQDAMNRGEVTSVELVDAYLARIGAYDQDGPRLNAIIAINPRARDTAAALDAERRESGTRGPLHGIPIVLKDNYDTADMPTTAGSIALAHNRPVNDGFQVRKLRDAGAVVIAKANLHELAMGITTISSLGGQTLNPYDLRRNPGGSSGGTGAAVASSFGAFGMGSDTCGSIRIPSAQNNLVGLRPTKGISSIAGILPLSHTQDTGGPLARNAADLAIALDATVGADPADPATSMLEDREIGSFVGALAADAVEGARFGRLSALFESNVAEPGVLRTIRAAIDQLEAMGAEIVDVDVPGLSELTAKASVINYEFKHDFIDYLDQNPAAPVDSLAEILSRGLYHEALRTRYELRERLGTRDGTEYLARLEWRTILRSVVVQVLDDNNLDALLYPTLVAAPSRIGEPQRGSNCSLSANSGLPAISVPAGFTANLLPVGLEILGRPLSDPSLVGFAYAFEQHQDHRLAPVITPPLVDGAAPLPVAFETVVAAPSGQTPIAHVSFTLDPIRNTLEYELDFPAVPAGQALGATLHIGEAGSRPAIERLAAPGVDEARGIVRLTPVQRSALDAGELYLRAFTRDDDPAALPAVPLTVAQR